MEVTKRAGQGSLGEGLNPSSLQGGLSQVRLLRPRERKGPEHRGCGLYFPSVFSWVPLTLST